MSLQKMQMKNIKHKFLRQINKTIKTQLNQLMLLQKLEKFSKKKKLNLK